MITAVAKATLITASRRKQRNLSAGKTSKPKHKQVYVLSSGVGINLLATIVASACSTEQ